MLRLSERLPRENGRDYALKNIKENIISLDLAPGCIISESDLAAQMGLSRTPIREALIELSKVKIVEIVPQRSSMVARIDYELVEESRFLRKILECAVIELVCDMASPRDIEHLEENVQLQKLYLDRNDSDQLMIMDNKFHAALFDIAHKSQIYALTQNFSIHFDRVRRLALESVKDLKIVEDHAAILEMIRTNQPARAKELTQIHLSRYKVDAVTIRAKYPEYF